MRWRGSESYILAEKPKKRLGCGFDIDIIINQIHMGDLALYLQRDSQNVFENQFTVLKRNRSDIFGEKLFFAVLLEQIYIGKAHG